MPAGSGEAASSSSNPPLSPSTGFNPDYPPTPAPLTSGNLLLHSFLPSPHDRVQTWAGVQSSIYLIGFDKDAADILGPNPATPVCLRSPKTNEDQWPLNTLVDWCFGGRVLWAFGTPYFQDFSRYSKLSDEVDRYRKAIGKKRSTSEDSSLKKRQRTDVNGAQPVGADA